MKKFLYDEVHLTEIPTGTLTSSEACPSGPISNLRSFILSGSLLPPLPEKAYGYSMPTLLSRRSVHVSLVGPWSGCGGGFIASAVFACNGFLMPFFSSAHEPVESYIWLPLVIYFVNRAVYAERVWGTRSSQACSGIQILAGAPQDSFYTFVPRPFSPLHDPGGRP